MLEDIINIIYDVTGKKEVTADTHFVQDLNLNSFDIVSIVGAFEERFRISVPTRDIWQFQRVSDVLAYMEEKGIGGR